MTDKDPNDFAPYAPYLHTKVWPTVDRNGVLEQVPVHRDEMAPQYAASALAKLVRWSRISPEGEVAHHGPDEDTREVFVRSTPLGCALAARAVNLDEEIFFAMYGEFGVTPKVERDMLGALLAVLLEEQGLDWAPRDRITLAMKVATGLQEEFNVHLKALT